ncbi:MAG: hypothetical protein ACI4XL_10920 [Bacillus sp. (in: firmicutes)]
MMEYTSYEFTLNLLKKISAREQDFKRALELFIDEYEPVFKSRNIRFEGKFSIQGEDPFCQGYYSAVLIGLLDENGGLLEVHTTDIWICTRKFLGFGKLIGRLNDRPLESVAEEWGEAAEEILVEFGELI